MSDRVEFLHDDAPEFMIEETRFMAEFGEVRVVCRIDRSGWYMKFGSNKSGPRGRAAVFEKNRTLIERAAERRDSRRRFRQQELGFRSRHLVHFADGRGSEGRLTPPRLSLNRPPAAHIGESVTYGVTVKPTAMPAA